MSSSDTYNDMPKDSSPADDFIYHEKTYSMGWLLPLLLLVLTAGLVMFFMKGCSDNSIPGLQAEEAATDTLANDTAQTTPVRKLLPMRLSDTVRIMAYKNGMENQLMLYILSKEPADSISKNRWFDFDELNFETNSAVITDSSMRQVENIATILKTYPKVKIKIGGYTDKTGDEAANMKLSQARAEAVLAALKKAGVNSAQLTGAEGYGSQFAKAAENASNEEKQKDRRISVNVRAK